MPSSTPTHTQPRHVVARGPINLRPVSFTTEAISTSPSSPRTTTFGSQVDFVQTILTPDPLVIGIRTDTDLVFAKPLHATPEYVFGTRPIYVMEDLEVLDEGHARRAMIDREIAELHDVTVRAEVVRYRSLTADLVYLEGRLMELERQWGEMSSKKLGCIRRLEMANVLARLETQRGNILDVEG